mgnify:CR=1 FL=1
MSSFAAAAAAESKVPYVEVPELRFLQAEIAKCKAWVEQATAMINSPKLPDQKDTKQLALRRKECKLEIPGALLLVLSTRAEV